MKKLFALTMAALTIGAVALSTGFIATPCALSNDIVSMDKPVTAATNLVTGTLSATYTAKPIWLNAWGLWPTNGTVTISYDHTDAAGVSRTTTLGAITDVNGSVSSNLSGLVSQYLFKREPIYLRFGTATNGALQLVGELYGIGK